MVWFLSLSWFQVFVHAKRVLLNSDNFHKNTNLKGSRHSPTRLNFDSIAENEKLTVLCFKSLLPKTLNEMWSLIMEWVKVEKTTYFLQSDRKSSLEWL